MDLGNKANIENKKNAKITQFFIFRGFDKTCIKVNPIIKKE